jgi:hypothetical protein
MELEFYFEETENDHVKVFEEVDLLKAVMFEEVDLLKAVMFEGQDLPVDQTQDLELVSLLLEQKDLE